MIMMRFAALILAALALPCTLTAARSAPSPLIDEGAARTATSPIPLDENAGPAGAKHPGAIMLARGGRGGGGGGFRGGGGGRGGGGFRGGGGHGGARAAHGGSFN